MKLHELPRVTKRATRVGRGISAGKGKTAGRGTKGQKARNNMPKGFEGGQTKLYMRLPKLRGGNQIRRPLAESVSLSTLEKHYTENSRVSLKTLKNKGLISSRAAYVKIIGTGKLTKTLKFSNVDFTGSVYKQLYGKSKNTKTNDTPTA